MAIVGAVAITGHYMGDDASARSFPASEWVDAVSSTPNFSQKASLLSEPQEIMLSVTVPELADREAVALEKGDFLIDESIVTPRSDRLVLLEPMLAPPLSQLEKTWRLGREQKQKLMAKREKRMSEQACLARAIYFEARSESELGQLAVARVILNRSSNPAYPNTICGVVYQGADRMNACQFSFACDGDSDNPRPGKQWDRAKQIAARAMAGGDDVQVVSTATHYHADYVRPRWSGAMTRLIKIGRHIFYNGS
ncbi:MAG: cell wall hydrolase [Parvibaculaceae bacterium]